MCKQKLLQNHRMQYFMILFRKSLAGFVLLQMVKDCFPCMLHLLLSKNKNTLYEDFLLFLALVRKTIMIVSSFFWHY